MIPFSIQRPVNLSLMINASALDCQHADNGVYDYYDDVLVNELNLLKRNHSDRSFLISSMIHYHNTVIDSVLFIYDMLPCAYFQVNDKIVSRGFDQVDNVLSYLNTKFDELVATLRVQ